MYALIFGSELEEAKKFKKWVTKEVLPTIRQTGGYTREAYLKLEEDRDKFKYLYHMTEDILEKKSKYR
jgi:prophage antirepressor-like protein